MAGRKYNKSQIKAIAEHLTKADKIHIREELGCHRNHIYQVLKGTYYDEKVIDKALEQIADRTEKQSVVDGVLSEALKAIEQLNSVKSL
ncbi:MAG: hypothetical protein ABJG41_09850 [Cyclobacteriaceae bacterium]